MVRIVTYTVFKGVIEGYCQLQRLCSIGDTNKHGALVESYWQTGENWSTLSTSDPAWYCLELSQNFHGYRWTPDCLSHARAVVLIIKAVGTSINNLLSSIGPCKFQGLEIICFHICHVVCGLN